MAIEINSYIEIIHLDDSSMKEIQRLFSATINSDEKKMLDDILKRTPKDLLKYVSKESLLFLIKLFRSRFNNDKTWMEENVGSKWILCELEIVDNNSANLNITSAYNAPFRLIEKIYSNLHEINQSVILHGYYLEESYSEAGAFVVGHDGLKYQTLEIPSQIDFERLSDDPDYRDKKLIIPTLRLRDKLLNAQKRK